LTAIRRRDVQALVDRLGAKGMAAGTIRNTLDPLRAIYRRALQRDRVAVNPTADLDVPAANNGRERSATRAEAAALLKALPDTERALWATAVYAGLRRGELRALRWEDIDLGAKMIHVRRGWDDAEGEIEPKTRGANRRVPIVAPLGKALRAHARATKRQGRDLVFGRTASLAFYPSTVRSRALKAWEDADPPLAPLGLHECRHTFASMMIAAGCNAKALSVVMGHASITITFDTYGHLMPGGEQEVGTLLGAYLQGS
jgi:integrase